jgi:Protein of unknown function (DUF1579)
MRSVCFVLAALALLAPATSLGFAQAPLKPGPEFDILKGMEGTWDATIKFGPQESKGTMTYKLGIGGLWLMSSFEGEFAGQKFEGHGMDSYDANKKKYVGVWVDSMVTSPLVMEGTYDPAEKKISMEGMGPGQDGKPVKQGIVTELKGKDEMFSSMSGPGPDGKQAVMMTITYKRKK